MLKLEKSIYISSLEFNNGSLYAIGNKAELLGSPGDTLRFYGSTTILKKINRNLIEDKIFSVNIDQANIASNLTYDSIPTGSYSFNPQVDFTLYFSNKAFTISSKGYSKDVTTAFEIFNANFNGRYYTPWKNEVGEFEIYGIARIPQIKGYDVVLQDRIYKNTRDALIPLEFDSAPTSLYNIYGIFNSKEKEYIVLNDNQFYIIDGLTLHHISTPPIHNAIFIGSTHNNLRVINEATSNSYSGEYLIYELNEQGNFNKITSISFPHSKITDGYSAKNGEIIIVGINYSTPKIVNGVAVYEKNNFLERYRSDGSLITHVELKNLADFFEYDVESDLIYSVINDKYALYQIRSSDLISAVDSTEIRRYKSDLTEDLDFVNPTYFSENRCKISDKYFAIDIDGSAGTTAKILGAVFGKDSVQNKQYVGIGLDLLDKGMDYSTLAGLAVNAAGLKTNDEIVSTLWKNVVGTSASAADKAPFIELLENGMTVGDLAKLAAETTLNAANIDLVGLASTGLEYTPVA